MKNQAVIINNDNEEKKPVLLACIFGKKIRY
jgi:hypothetical protein